MAAFVECQLCGICRSSSGSVIWKWLQLRLLGAVHQGLLEKLQELELFFCYVDPGVLAVVWLETIPVTRCGDAITS